MRKEMWWKDMKLKLIIGGIVGVIIIIIIGTSLFSHVSLSLSIIIVIN